MIERIALVGMMGSGKSTAGRFLARRLDLPFIDLDRTIEEAEGASIAAIFAERGEDEFRRMEKIHLRTVCRGRRGVLAAGGGAVIDAENRARLAGWGVVVYLRASPETLAARLSGEEARLRPLLLGGPLEERLAAIVAAREPFYREARLVVETDGLTPGEVAGRILDGLGLPPA
ncbi:MAG: shikimate kinase [Candidatus Eisenbacteria bacterium]